MYFGTKSYLKSNHYHTVKHTRRSGYHIYFNIWVRSQNNIAVLNRIFLKNVVGVPLKFGKLITLTEFY